MDSLTQFVLGAGVGVACLGRRIGPRKAALIGGALGTLPDLDVLLPASDPIDAFVNHRGFSHSWLVHTAVTPVFGEILRRIDPRLREHRWTSWLAVWLALTSHALLDAFTTYGTRVLWPLSVEPVSWSTIFIIDPIYTLPLLVVAVMSLGRRDWRPGFGAWVAGALLLSTAYLGWTLVAQTIARDKVMAALAASDRRFDRVMMIPMPFNSLLWRGLAVNGEHYANVYVSILDTGGPAKVHVHERGVSHEGQADRRLVDPVAEFSDGFYALKRVDDHLHLADLRLGVTPDYVFIFRIGRFNGERVEPIFPVKLARRIDPDGFDWLWRRIFDESAIRAE